VKKFHQKTEPVQDHDQSRRELKRAFVAGLEELDRACANVRHILYDVRHLLKKE
jgi:hypothetical protein